MQIKNQPKLLLAIYALLAVLAIIFAALLYVNPLSFESTLTATQSANIAGEAELLRQKGQAAQAEKLCLNALKHMQNADGIQKAKLYHGLGLTYFQEKKYEESQNSQKQNLCTNLRSKKTINISVPWKCNNDLPTN
ncbi:MAG: tetratricopeptide repeat protein [Candidatus Melainabacteria bacterium]|nr:tetratricopeptide repeat protein [Candidatus Melainabacteria bacterium]